MTVAEKPASTEAYYCPPTRSIPIPVEIVAHILDAAYLGEDLKPDVGLLKSCALVSKAWSVPAQKLLFRNPTLSSEPACTAFSAATDLSTAHGRTLSNSVLSLKVTLDPNQPSGLSRSSFARTVVSCPRLHSLELSIYGSTSALQDPDTAGSPDGSRVQRTGSLFDDSIVSTLKTSSSITTLTLHNYSDNTHHLAQLLEIWPAVTSLTISGTAPTIGLGVGPVPSLEHLRLDFQSHPTSVFIAWLLSTSTNTLRALDLVREPPPEILSLLTQGTYPLKSLRIPTCRVPAVKKLHALTELITESPWAPSSGVYASLPHDATHIGLGVDKNTELGKILTLIRSRPAMSHVTVHLWNGAERHPQMPDLTWVCAEAGVQLRVTRDIRVYRRLSGV